MENKSREAIKISKLSIVVNLLLSAGKLAAGFKQVRVDFYEADGACYFGEMTFFHGAGFMPFEPFSFDQEMGNLWTL